MVDDIKVKKTDTERMEARDRFFLNFTPVWFNWLEWVIIIGAIQIIAAKTYDLFVNLVLGLSYCFLMLYMVAFFYRIKFYDFQFIWSGKIRIIASSTLSLLIGNFIFYLLSHLIAKLS